MPRTLPRIKLDRSPLVLVLVQARFSQRTDLEERLPAFRKACESLGYPVFRTGRVHTMNIGVAGPGGVEEATRWDFLDKSQRWNVILAPEFLVLQTTEYSTFEEFLGRWSSVLEAATCLDIPLVERLGLRYVDLVQPTDDELPSHYLIPAFAGFEPDPASGFQRTYHTTATAIQSDKGQMIVRVSPARTPVPQDLEALHLKGFKQPTAGATFLDFDHSTSEAFEFDSSEVARRTEGLHDAPDVLFRTIVTEHAMGAWGKRDLA